MQRAALREEKTKKEDEVKSDGNFPTTSSITRKWYFFFLLLPFIFGILN